MNGRRWGFAGWWKAAGIAAIVAVPVALVAMSSAQNTPKAQSSSTSSKRLGRELSIMEKVIDQMLLDSQNFLVYSTEDNTRGLYLDEFGVLFSFQASLLNRKNESMFNWKDFNVDEKDGTIILSPKEEKDKDKDSGDEDMDENDPGVTVLRNWKERSRNSQQRLYTQGKAEIMDILLDYGDSMTSLRDGQWLAIAAFLKGSDFFLDRRISRLVIKAKMSDLRAYAANQIDRDTMMKRVIEEEY